MYYTERKPKNKKWGRPGNEARITAGFVTVCFSMVNKNFMHPFLRSTKLLCYTHVWTKLHKNLMLWAECLALMMSLFLVLTWSELNYCAWFEGTVCEQPALVCHDPQSFFICVEFVTEHKFALARVQIWNPAHPFVQFKYSVYGHKQASRHAYIYIRVLQCSPTSVGLAQARPNQATLCPYVFSSLDGIHDYLTCIFE